MLHFVTTHWPTLTFFYKINYSHSSFEISCAGYLHIPLSAWIIWWINSDNFLRYDASKSSIFLKSETAIISRIALREWNSSNDINYKSFNLIYRPLAIEASFLLVSRFEKGNLEKRPTTFRSEYNNKKQTHTHTHTRENKTNSVCKSWHKGSREPSSLFFLLFFFLFKRRELRGKNTKEINGRRGGQSSAYDASTNSKFFTLKKKKNSEIFQEK